MLDIKGEDENAETTDAFHDAEYWFASEGGAKHYYPKSRLETPVTTTSKKRRRKLDAEIVEAGRLNVETPVTTTL